MNEALTLPGTLPGILDVADEIEWTGPADVRRDNAETSNWHGAVLLEDSWDNVSAKRGVCLNAFVLGVEPENIRLRLEHEQVRDHVVRWAMRVLDMKLDDFRDDPVKLHFAITLLTTDTLPAPIRAQWTLYREGGACAGPRGMWKFLIFLFSAEEDTTAWREARDAVVALGLPFDPPEPPRSRT